MKNDHSLIHSTCYTGLRSLHCLATSDSAINDNFTSFAQSSVDFTAADVDKEEIMTARLTSQNEAGSVMAATGCSDTYCLVFQGP